MLQKKLKIRISNGANTAIGPGKAQLLESIINTGSISKAAKQMNMSYRRAWELVSVMNESFQSPLVVTSHGGAHGGGAQVSELGLNVLKHFRNLEKKINKESNKDLYFIYSVLNNS